jgi:hypothetical protein
MMDCALGSGTLVLDAAKHLVRRRRTPPWTTKLSRGGIEFSNPARDGGPPASGGNFGRSATQTSPPWLVKERVRSLLWACATPKILRDPV